MSYVNTAINFAARVPAAVLAFKAADQVTNLIKEVALKVSTQAGLVKLYNKYTNDTVKGYTFGAISDSKVTYKALAKSAGSVATLAGGAFAAMAIASRLVGPATSFSVTLPVVGKVSV